MAAHPDKRPAAKVDTRTALRTAALELFVKKGYHNTTTAQISRAVGLSSAALYAHYTSKEELAWEIFRDVNVMAAEGLRARLDVIDSAHERIRVFIEHVFSWTMAHRNEAIFLFLIRHSEFFSRQRQLEADGRGELVQIFLEAVQLGVRNGEVPPTDMRTLRKATAIPLVYMRDWLEDWDTRDLLDYTEDATRMCARALGME